MTALGKMGASQCAACTLLQLWLEGQEKNFIDLRDANFMRSLNTILSLEI